MDLRLNTSALIVAILVAVVTKCKTEDKIGTFQALRTLADIESGKSPNSVDNQYIERRENYDKLSHVPSSVSEVEDEDEYSGYPGKAFPMERSIRGRTLFRFGKRNGRTIFRFGKREFPLYYTGPKRTLFRWGKRAGDDEEDDFDKRSSLFRFGKRQSIFRFGRSVGKAPHTPFRFGREDFILM